MIKIQVQFHVYQYFVVANLAAGHPCTQSSIKRNAPAGGAVDGLYGKNNKTGQFSSGTCAHTDVDEDVSWWAVNLEAYTPIWAVDTVNRASRRLRKIYIPEMKIFVRK